MIGDRSLSGLVTCPTGTISPIASTARGREHTPQLLTTVVSPRPPPLPDTSQLNLLGQVTHLRARGMACMGTRERDTRKKRSLPTKRWWRETNQSRARARLSTTRRPRCTPCGKGSACLEGGSVRIPCLLSGHPVPVTNSITIRLHCLTSSSRSLLLLASLLSSFLVLLSYHSCYLSPGP